MMIKFKSILFFIAALFVFPQNPQAAEYKLNHNPHAYVLNKLQSYDIVFLGTWHKQPPILGFVSKLITVLHNSGVTHIGLGITSGQQSKIDNFLKTGAGLSAIKIHPLIDCPEYRNIFNVLRDLDPDKGTAPVALDLPKSRYKGNTSRDEWMARSIAGAFEANPNVKMLVIVGNNHILKRLDWQDHISNKHRSIRQFLEETRRKLRIFSIGQVSGESVYDFDFLKRFGTIEGAVALDLDGQFEGWKLSITQSLAIKPAEVWELLDEVIVY